MPTPRRLSRRIGLLALTGLALGGQLLTVLASSASPAVPTAPRTIPALQTWTAGAGSFTPRADVRIVVPVADAPALRSYATLLAGDLRRMGRLDTSVHTGKARPGDIRLSRSTEEVLGPEGYRLEVGSVLSVSAPTRAGVFYGTRTILQLLQQSTSVPGGVGTDRPRYPDRGVMVDAGRRYYSPTFYRRLIERMAYLKLNLLHLHLSDEAGLGVESTRHPEVMQPEYLTKAQMADLVRLAAERHIRVVPEIDMPGHMSGILADHPELQLRNALGVPDPARLDVTNPAARAFVKDLVEEFLPLFPGVDFHLGADEYLKAAEYPLYPVLTTWAIRKYGPQANGKDAVHDFVNDMAAFVKAHGKRPRIWNDDAGGGSAVRLDPDLVVEWWTNFNPLSDPVAPSPGALVADGHEVLNNGWWPTYFGSPGLPAPDMRQAYDKWRVHDFYGTLYYDSTVQFPPYSLAPDEPANRGAKLAIWSDGPVYSEAEIAELTLPHLRVVAQRTWESPDPGDYDTFLAIGAAIGPGPGQE